MTASSTMKPSALVAAAHIIASDGPGEVVRKLDAAFDAAVAHRSDLPSGAAPQAPAAPVGLPWRTGIPPWTDDRSVRVIAVTAQDDFGGVQVHDIRASDFHTDGDGDGAEVARVCTHWAYRDDIWPRADAVAPAAAIPWDNFPAYLIDHCEGQTITEEGLQRALAAMLTNPQYATAAPAAPAPMAWPVARDVLERMATFANMASRCGKDRSIENLRKLAQTLQHLADQAPAVATSAPAALPGVVFDMVALVKQLVLEHRIAEPNSLLASQALGYLKSHGLLDSPLRVHGDDSALDRFALAMRAKLAAARAKGRGGWETCAPEALNRMLHEHLEKGDPRDVANFCMFLWHTGHRTTMPAPAAPSPLSVRQVHPLGTAPKDGTIVQLLVQFVAHPPGQETVLNGAGPLYDTADACWTIGGNSVENTGIDHWQFVGWNWEQDYFVDTSTDAGHRVLGWAPFDVAAPAVDAPVLPAIKGAWIDGGYVIVTPAGTGQAKAVKAAILAALPVAPDAASAKNKGVE
ncbi:hypothetical protein [Delftia tsuruhatensis]|uniref:hypothetical protein n=1 Tax=Delftia tsuruhatensis TaxID=180282 RepID=UPI00202943FA|nr:hypothetical protein [Delftia tsuruhatensis]